MNATLRSPGQHRRLAPLNATLLAASLLASWTPLEAQENRALFLDGDGDYMTVPSAAGLQHRSTITIEAWINPVATANQFGSFVNKGDGQTALSQRTYELRWFPDGGVGIWFFLDHIEGTPAAADLGAPVPAGTWTHIAATLDTGAGLATVYTNGVSAGSRTTLNGTPLAGRLLRQTTLPVVLGWTPGHASTYASGQMDEVRIWSVARTAAEIQRDMSCRLLGGEPGLEAYWNFDLGAPVDLTGNGHNGTLAGDAVIAVVPGPDVIHAGCGDCIPRGARATAVVVNGFVVGIDLLDGGCGYETAPTVRIVGGGGEGATATAVIDNGRVVEVVATGAGSGYSESPNVFVESPPYMPSLEIAVSRVLVTLRVRVNHNYVLESSFDCQTWMQVGYHFTADAESLTMEFEVADTGRYFRIQEVP